MSTNFGSHATIESIIRELDHKGYVADEELATLLFLLLKSGKPLLLEGHPGVGKTELAYALAAILDTKLIRLQCYEGLDINNAVYEWNYQKQLLSIKIQETADASDTEKERHIFGPDYLLTRPLLESISCEEKSPVLLIDEIDRADEEFEAYLLELLSAFQITIPEMGTIKAKHKPYVILTSNRTRELSDALRRRCLFHWIDYPHLEREIYIVKKRLPEIEETLARRVVSLVQKLRHKNLSKTPGVSETIDWASALIALGYSTVEQKELLQTMGCILKSADDIARLKEEYMEELLSA
jgi:MoxR-like ATPase